MSIGGRRVIQANSDGPGGANLSSGGRSKSPARLRASSRRVADPFVAAQTARTAIGCGQSRAGSVLACLDGGLSGGQRLGRLAVRLSVLAMAIAATALAQQRAEFQPVKDVPGLPRVLVIGDSISIGYTLPLRAALQGVANVHRPPTNCAHTWRGLEKIDEWLGDGRWDVIHFNWGLHDLKYVDAEGGLALPPRGKQVSTLEEYEANLEKLVVRLKRTGADLVWRPTTPVPAGASGRIPADLPRYNAAAQRVIERHGVAVDDMNAFIAAEKIPHVRPDNVHFSREASARLAGNSAAAIRRALRRE